MKQKKKKVEKDKEKKIFYDADIFSLTELHSLALPIWPFRSYFKFCAGISFYFAVGRDHRSVFPVLFPILYLRGTRKHFSA